VFRYHSTYPTAIQAIATGRIAIKDIVTGVFPFEDAKAGFVDALDNKAVCIKNVIHID
jgi:L-iditol 2-dehydrogenase